MDEETRFIIGLLGAFDLREDNRIPNDNHTDPHEDVKNDVVVFASIILRRLFLQKSELLFK